MTVEIRWPDEDKSVSCEPGQSLLEIALANGIALDHACGSVCACSTCHGFPTTATTSCARRPTTSRSPPWRSRS